MKNNIIALLLIIAPLIAQAEPTPETSSDSAENLQLSLTRMRLLMETNKVDEALQLINTLKIAYPGNGEVIATEAELYLQLDYRGKSLELMRQAATIAPENEDILQRSQEILSGKETFAAAEGELRRTGHSIREQISRVKGQIDTHSPLSIALIVENDRMRASNITRANGLTTTIRDDMQRGELGAIYTLDNGDEAKASFYGAESNVGVGASYGIIDTSGMTTLTATLNRPSWEFIALVIDNGTKDTLQLSRTQIITPSLSLMGEAALNRYNVSNNNDAMRSFAFNADLSYTLPHQYPTYLFGNDAIIKLDYIANAEYPFSSDERTTASGARFHPLPIQHYEIHSLQLTVDKKFFNTLNFEAYGGYAIDRFGNSGPAIGTSLSYQPTEHVILEALASRTIRKERTSEQLDIIGVNVRWIL
jgi:hypothetical protein